MSLASNLIVDVDIVHTQKTYYHTIHVLVDRQEHTIHRNIYTDVVELPHA